MLPLSSNDLTRRLMSAGPADVGFLVYLDVSKTGHHATASVVLAKLETAPPYDPGHANKTSEKAPWRLDRNIGTPPRTGGQPPAQELRV